jgi:hypothetical protein
LGNIQLGSDSEVEEMSARCEDLSWDIQQGKIVADYLRKRTQAKPFFAVASAVMHSCPCNYKNNQPYVERMMKKDPQTFLDPKAAREAVKGAEHPNSRAVLLPEATKCYLKHCRERECLKEKGREKLTGCLFKIVKQYETMKGESRYTGLGWKIIDLAREYLGDPTAVAVDRHVKNWASKKAKIVSISARELKSETVTPKTYQLITEAVRAKAAECGMTAADLQVAAWLSGACKDEIVKRKGKPRAQRLYIGEGLTIDCVHRKMPPLTRWTS